MTAPPPKASLSPPPPPRPPPSSVLIVGSGVFGLSILHEILQRPAFSDTILTLLDAAQTYPPPHSASIDTTRIIRADYASPDYAALARSAQTLWRTRDWAADGRYSESGLLLTADAGERGAAYVAAALANVRDPSHGGGPIFATPDAATIARAMRGAPADAAAGTGASGYLNPRSGWADAEATMRHLRARVEALAHAHTPARATFLHGTAVRVTSHARTRRATGVQLADGRLLAAELTILATGAWTPALADLRGVAAARAQCVAYVPVSRDEQAALAGCPVHFNVSSGMFFFPPAGGEIKVARHAYGFANPVRVAAPYGSPELDGAPPCETAEEEHDSTSGAMGKNTITVSSPVFPSDLPAHDAADLKNFLQTALPGLHDVSKRPHRSRLCWYLDTRSADFLVCHYPLPGDGASDAVSGEADNDPRTTSPKHLRSTSTPAIASGLFLATAGSGHAFKFLPVLGARCVDVLLDGLDGNGTDTSEWTRRWGWPGRHAAEGLGGAGCGDDGDVWCEDGSRAGERGRVLSEALRAAA